MVKKILGGDILIADVMVPLPTPEELAGKDVASRAKYQALNAMIDEVLAEQKVQRGQKAKLTKEQFIEIAKLTSGLTTKVEPGGSTANTLTTLKKLLGKEVEAEMIGVVGEDRDSQIIRAGLEQADIKLIPAREEIKGAIPESALSFVFTTKGGQRTILTYPGNARDLIKSETITSGLVGKTDIVFMQGSMWEKFDEAVPDKIMHERWNADAKEIWLALPTHAKFRDNMPPERYRKLIPSADVVLGNIEELKRIYETEDFGAAIAKLQEALRARDTVLAREFKSPHAKEPIGFITRGAEGATVVTKDRTYDVSASDLSRLPRGDDGKPIIFELGAGDSSYAGFLAAHMAGLSPEQCGTLGMQVAGAKLQFNSARMPDPREAVSKFSESGRALLREVDRRMANLRLEEGAERVGGFNVQRTGVTADGVA